MEKRNVQPVLDLFKKLNGIPRPSHHEEKVADFLVNFAESLQLEYERDAQNCVVIRKPATPGHEQAEPVVILNHMDMVCVSVPGKNYDPENDTIEAYVEDGWMKAKGTSLGADNGMGLSMALAVLADDTLVHGPIEVLTTTNEEDGMSGAANLSLDFIKGRKVINLDSEDYDTITIGAAGAYLQRATFPFMHEARPKGFLFYELTIGGGHGGHSGVDINKGRINANKELGTFLYTECMSMNIVLASFNGGEANASIASFATAVIGVKTGDAGTFTQHFEEFAEQLKQKYAETDPEVTVQLEAEDDPQYIVETRAALCLLSALYQIPAGVIRMHPELLGTVMTSNNIGVVRTEENLLVLTLHTRSFDYEEMTALGQKFSQILESQDAMTEVIMSAPAWQENPDSDYLKLVDETFQQKLDFSPRKVAMHFVLEAGYYVQKYPGIQIACIGPRIVEPHSTKERVEMSTVENIWQVVVELLERLA